MLFLIVINISGRSVYLVHNFDVNSIVDSLYTTGQYDKCKNQILTSKIHSFSDTIEVIEKLASCYSYLHRADSAIILLDYLHTTAPENLDIGISYNHIYFHDLIVDNRMSKYDSIMKVVYIRDNIGKNTILGIELLDIIRKDQEPRCIQEYVQKIKTTGGNTDIKIDSMFWSKMKISDEQNMEHVAAIIHKYGYPGFSMVGGIPCYGAQIVIRHSDLKYKIEFLPIMKSAAEKGELDGGSVEALEDRILVDQGKKQLYATQYCLDSITKKFALCPIEDPDKLQDRLHKAELLYPVR